MRSSHLLGSFILAPALALSPYGALSQQPEKKPATETASSRLANAKNVLVTRAHGSDIPYDTIKSTIDGWGRFTLVDTPEKADLVVTVATTGGDSGVRVASSNDVSPLSGRPEQSSSSSKDFSSADITLTVYDAKNKRVLWTSTETAKSALRQTTRENNLVEAAARLAVKFHDKLEPPPPREKD
jgi:predicted Zn-dependent protease